jgi:hypothetical protein
MRPIRLLAALGSSALLGACVSAKITVTPSGQNLELAPRKADCVVEFYRTRGPDRRFDEVATLHLDGKNLDAWEAQERLRRRACELGADAVVVTRDYLLGTMTGTAVSYPEIRADPGARLVRDARGIADLMPPQGFSVATCRVATPIRSGWDANAEQRGALASGTEIWAKQMTKDVCSVRHPDGREGWVDCGALVFGAQRTEEKPARTAPFPSSI